MIRCFAIVDKNTSRQEKGCPQCLLYRTNLSEVEALSQYSVEDNHKLIQITSDEFRQLKELEYTVDRAGKEFLLADDTEILEGDKILSIKKNTI